MLSNILFSKGLDNTFRNSCNLKNDRNVIRKADTFHSNNIGIRLDIKVLDRDRNVIEIPELDPEDMAPPSKNNAPEQDKQESLTTLLPEDEDADAISNDFPDNDFPLNDLDSDSEDDDLSIPLSFDDDEENEEDEE